MAGHSKWANIQHRKRAQDAKRGKLFTKIIREVVTAARLQGDDPETNPRLRLAFEKAFAANMSKDTVVKAAQRGAGNADGEAMEELVYEGYGVAGVAVLGGAMTDNRNRTVAEVRHAFTKCGGNLGTEGSVNYLFTKQGQLCFAPGSPEEAILEVALEAGALDVISNGDGSIEVVTSPENFAAVKEAMDKADLKADAADVIMNPSTVVEIKDQAAADNLMKLVDMLEDCDDVQNVYHNGDIDTEIG